MNADQEQQVSQLNRITPSGRPTVGAVVGQDNLFQVMWRGKWLILLTSLSGLVCTHLYLKNQVQVPLYHSRAAILIDKPANPGGPDMPQPVGGSASNYLQTHASMIKSRTIINAALQDPEVSTLPSLIDANDPEAYLKEVLSVRLVKKTDIFNISAQTPYPGDSAAIVNAVIRAYIQWHETNKRATTADLLKDLNQQLEKHQKELSSKRAALVVFEKRMMTRSQGGTNSDLMSMIRQNLERARMREIQLGSYREGLLRLEDAPDKFYQYVQNKQSEVNLEIQPEEWNQLGDELNAVRAQIEAFEAGELVAKRSDVELLKNKAKRLEAKMDLLEGQYITQHISLVKSLLEDTRLQVIGLQETYGEKLAEAIGHSEWETERSRLVSECQMSEKICNSLLDQIHQLDLSENLQNLNIHILEDAVPSEAAIPSDDLRTYALGLIIGMVSGAGLTAFRQWKDKRIKSADEITGILRLPILGTVPSIKKRGFVARGQRLKLAVNSAESEAYRSIRTSILLGAPGAQPTTVLVTSAMASEGKTTLVSNLGIAMAQAGMKSIILDADLRKPERQRIFTRDGHGLGLADVLTGAATLEEAIRRSETPGLDVLGSGKNPTNPSELLNSPEFEGVLQRLKQEYNLILIDSAPVGLVTDAQITATLCDLTLLVLRAGKSTRPRMLHARNALFSVGARRLGCIVNDVPRRDTCFGDYSGRGYELYYRLDAGQSNNGSRNGKQVGRPKHRGKPARTLVGSVTADRSKKHRYTPAYKMSIVEEALACRDSGQIKALLEQEGLRPSLLTKWREQYRAGTLKDLQDSSWS